MEKITKKIPLIYPIIIFVGYYNYRSYYQFFDIEIFPYLTIYEILFSIVSQLMPVFIICFLILCYLIFLIVLPLSSKEKREEKKNDIVDDEEFSEVAKKYRRMNSKNDNSTSLIFNNFHLDLVYRLSIIKKKVKRKKHGRAISHFILLIGDIFAVFIKILLWMFFILFTSSAILVMFKPIDNNLDYYRPFFTSTSSLIISTLIWLAITYALITRISKNTPKPLLSFGYIFPLIFLLFLSITIYQKMEAEKTVSYKTQDIRFEYNNENIKSSSKMVFVGKTANYIFLRDLKNKENYIYPISDVKNLVISQIHK